MPRTRALYAYQWSCQGHVQAVVAFLLLKVSALVGTPGDGPLGTVAVGLRRAAVVSVQILAWLECFTKHAVCR